jgi:hypothetical protein
MAGASPALDDYDVLVFPGFMRRNMAKWNEDGKALHWSLAHLNLTARS